MPIAITGPAGTNDYGTIVSGAFSPGAGSLLVALVVANNGITLSNSGTARTWTQRKVHASRAGVAIYTAPNPTSLTGITVTASGASGGMRLFVVTGHNTTSPIGASGTGSTTTNNATITGYNSTSAGSRGFCCALDGAGTYLSAPTSTDDEYGFALADAAAGLAITKAANTATAGEAVQFNLDASGTAAADWHWAALEILPDSLDASASLTVVEVAVTTPAPDASAGAGTDLATVPVTTTTPAPTVSAGAGATLSTVAVGVTVPQPIVTLDATETVALATVPITTAVPAPSVAAGSAVQLGGPVAVTTAVWSPSVVAQFNADVDLPHVAIGVEVPQPIVSVPVLPGDQLDGIAGQIEWNGFLLGSGTPYRQLGLEGWRGKEPPDSGNAPRANRHGSAPGRPLARERTLTWTGLLRASREEVAAAVLALENATPHLRDARQWPIVVDDFGGTPYLAYGRIDRVHIPVDLMLRLGVAKIAIQWILAEPRRYNINATGVTVPLDEIVEITNAGNAETSPLIVIPGPVTTPRLHNLTLDRVTEWTVTVPAGQKLVIDTDLGTAKLYSAADVEVANVGNNMSFSSVSVWDWILDRGTQEVEYTSASGGSQAEVLYRDAWI